MLLFWQLKATTELIQALAPYDNTPKEQLYRLVQLMVDLNSDQYGGFKAEPAIRHWAVFLPEAEQAIGNVDRLRLAWLRERFEKIGQEKEQATINAANFYALVMGLEQLELHGKASLKTGLTAALDQMLK
jgi:hypothetical protein